MQHHADAATVQRHFYFTELLRLQAELVKLRREKRVLELENEILKRAAAYFARENVLPK